MPKLAIKPQRTNLYCSLLQHDIQQILNERVSLGHHIIKSN